jgi:hypothetical protein
MCIFCTIVLAACSTTPAPVENPRQVWCDHNQPWRLPAVAIVMLNRAELDTLNSHNAKGERWCGWAP